MRTNMRELGWVEGKNLLSRAPLDGRSGKNAIVCRGIVRLNVELILTNGTAATLAAKSATTRIPIVFSAAFDPIRYGLVDDLAKPGGNVTGYSNVSTEQNTKLIEILRELLPSARRVGVLIHPPNPTFREEYVRACRLFGLEPVVFEVASVSALENAVAEAARQRVNALFVSSVGTSSNDDAALMRAAIKRSLPTFTRHKQWVELGGLVSLMADLTEHLHRIAYYVDKILRGAKPRDLPVEQPNKFVLSINLKTAKALGLTIPQPLLQRANEVIQ